MNERARGVRREIRAAEIAAGIIRPEQTIPDYDHAPDHRRSHAGAFVALLDRVPVVEREVVREVWDHKGAGRALEARRLYRLAGRLREEGDTKGGDAVLAILEFWERCFE